MDEWIAQLEDQTRKFPREAILISFLAGALLQIFAGHALLSRLVMKVGQSNCCYLCRLATASVSP